MRRWFLLTVILLAAVSLWAQDEGSALFKNNCARCHNANGDGKTTAGEKMKIPDLRSDEIQKMSDEQLYQTIGNGTQHKQYPHTFLAKGMHPGEVKQLVAHIRTLKTKK
jgi:mono/diheme cytochrome c family protein